MGIRHNGRHVVVDREPYMLLRKFLLSLLLALCSAVAHANAFAYVQSNVAVGTNRTSIAYVSNVTAGNRLFIFGYYGNSFVTVTDTQSNTWVSVPNIPGGFSIFTAVAGASAAETITVNCGGGCGQQGWIISEYSVPTSGYTILALAGSSSGCCTVTTYANLYFPSTDYVLLSLFGTGNSGYTITVSNATMRQTTGAIPGSETCSWADTLFTGSLNIGTRISPSPVFSGGAGGSAPSILMVAWPAGGGGGSTPSNYGWTR